jgi:cytochrome c peroxidase
VPLAAEQRGPRALVVVGGRAYAANYFSDSLSRVDLAEPAKRIPPIALGPAVSMSQVRLGEYYFHSAEKCFQGWQSCASCHPGDARVDAYNWDLLNDGIGNPKNNRSLLYSHRIQPAMALGVRASAEMAVRAGFKFIQFTEQPEEVASAVDAYLKSLEPVPSPRLIKGQLSPTAQRGEKLFHNPQVGCAECHPRGLFTDMKRYDVGTRGALDRPGDEFYTTTLIEVWRTAPYLHDGSAATMREVLTTRNAGDQHGRTSHLQPAEIDALIEYVLSL